MGIIYCHYYQSLKLQRFDFFENMKLFIALAASASGHRLEEIDDGIMPRMLTANLYHSLPSSFPISEIGEIF